MDDNRLCELLESKEFSMICLIHFGHLFSPLQTNRQFNKTMEKMKCSDCADFPRLCKGQHLKGFRQISVCMAEKLENGEVRFNNVA